MRHGFRILSSYKVHTGVTIWIITQVDRSPTTILLPEEHREDETIGVRIIADWVFALAADANTLSVVGFFDQTCNFIRRSLGDLFRFQPLSLHGVALRTHELGFKHKAVLRGRKNWLNMQLVSRLQAATK